MFSSALLRGRLGSLTGQRRDSWPSEKWNVGKISLPLLRRQGLLHCRVCAALHSARLSSSRSLLSSSMVVRRAWFARKAGCLADGSGRSLTLWGSGDQGRVKRKEKSFPSGVRCAVSHFAPSSLLLQCPGSKHKSRDHSRRYNSAHSRKTDRITWKLTTLRLSYPQTSCLRLFTSIKPNPLLAHAIFLT